MSNPLPHQNQVMINLIDQNISYAERSMLLETFDSLYKKKSLATNGIPTRKSSLSSIAKVFIESNSPLISAMNLERDFSRAKFGCLGLNSLHHGAADSSAPVALANYDAEIKNMPRPTTLKIVRFFLVISA